MFDTATGITEGIRDERAALRERSMDWRQRRLQHKMEALHGELEREREARRALADAMGSIGGRTKRSRGFLRLVLIGGGAYILGTRAGRERYDQMVGWFRGTPRSRPDDRQGRAGRCGPSRGSGPRCGEGHRALDG